ncbi:MAG: proton-conducting transporter membrane subunit [Thermoplasmata archaeon]|nr:proton-conducting transporter membrane subunit [Thermoplasmata archaeon]
MEEGTFVAAYMLFLIVPAVAGIVCGFIRRESGAKAGTALCSISCIAGILCYPVWMLVPDFTCTFPVGSLLGDYSVSVDQLTAVFVSISSAVFLMVVVHMSHSGHGYGSGYSALVCALFVSCILCMTADSAVLLLVSWEIVSVVTFAMASSRREGPRWRFFAITHLGGLTLMAVVAYLAWTAGTGDIGQWDNLSATLGQTSSAILIFLLFIGFGTKLGTIPFHAWMPDMYAESPTHTTALLTTLCSNVAVLVLFKGVFSWIGVGEGMETVGVVLCVLSAATALWGAMESMVQTEPKRILAYSSMENMALVTMCLSLAVVFSGSLPGLCALVTIAGLLHTLNHSVFKSLMMLTVDSIEDVTGERKIDRMGGIACVLPGLSVVALFGIMSLAAIPPMNGFVSEWLMLQSLLGTDAMASNMRVAMPLLVALLGVCGMIVATSYARLYGFIFLGRPRSEGAANPRPLRKGSLAPLAVLAGMCLAMGLLAIPLMDAMASGVSSLTGSDASYSEAMSGTLEPLTLGLMLAGCVAVMFAATRVFRRNREIGDTWGCGGTLDERMQYSSEGFSQPIVRVFHPIYQDSSEKKGDSYTTSFVEPFVKYIYRPLGALITWFSKQVTRIQTGNIQSYLSYILVTLVVALLAVRLL